MRESSLDKSHSSLFPWKHTVTVCLHHWLRLTTCDSSKGVSLAHGPFPNRIGGANGNGGQYHHYSLPPASVDSAGDPGLIEMLDTRPAGAIREWRPREEAAREAAHGAGPQQQVTVPSHSNKGSHHGRLWCQARSAFCRQNIQMPADTIPPVASGV